MRRTIIAATLVSGWIVALVIAGGGPTDAQDTGAGELATTVAVLQTRIAKIESRQQVQDSDLRVLETRSFPPPNPRASSATGGFFEWDEAYLSEEVCRIRRSSEVTGSWVLTCFRYGTGRPVSAP